MSNPMTYRTPKRIAISRYLGSFSLVKDLFSSDRNKPAKPAANAEGAATLQELANKPSVVLYQATTVFPFKFFPDTITIDTEQIKIQHKEFFYIKNVNSINHEDILNVTVESGPFFATLKIATRFFHADNLEISTLWKKDAFELRDIIHGLMVAHHRGVEIEGSDKSEIKSMLKNVGEVGHAPTEKDSLQAKQQT